jgi:hypothetical protein
MVFDSIPGLLSRRGVGFYWKEGIIFCSGALELKLVNEGDYCGFRLDCYVVPRIGVFCDSSVAILRWWREFCSSLTAFEGLFGFRLPGSLTWLTAMAHSGSVCCMRRLEVDGLGFSQNSSLVFPIFGAT